MYKGEFLLNSVVTQPNSLYRELGIENGCVTLEASLISHAKTTNLSIVKIICYGLKSCIGGVYDPSKDSPVPFLLDQFQSIHSSSQHMNTKSEHISNINVGQK